MQPCSHAATQPHSHAEEIVFEVKQCGSDENPFVLIHTK